MSDVRITQTLKPSDVGNLSKTLESIPKGDTKTVAHLGVIIGMASGISYRSNKYSDEPSIAMIGVFEATPYDPAEATVRAQSLFLNAAVQAMLVKAMVGDKPLAVTKAPKIGQKIDEDLGLQMPIKCEIGVVRNANEQGVGYQYVINLIGALEKIDVLESLRSEIVKEGGERVKQIANVNRTFTTSRVAIAPTDVKKLAAPSKKKGKR
jgi:hypothetical protein